MTHTRRAPAATRKRDTDLAQDLWTQARLWWPSSLTIALAFLTWAVYGIAPIAAAALLVAAPLVATHVADGAHRAPGWRRRFGWHPAGWPRAIAQRTVSAGLRQTGRRLKRCPRWLDELAQVGHALTRPYANAAVRRSWWHALNAAGLPQARVRRVTRTVPGARLDLTMPAGCPAAWLHDHSEHIATTFGARNVRVERDPANAARAVAHLTFRDPFDAAPAVWPIAKFDNGKLATTSVWEPLPLGLDENSQPLTLALLEPGHGAHSTLLGGIPGSGKSTTINLVLAYAALDPACTVFLIDGKPPGLAPVEANRRTARGRRHPRGPGRPTSRQGMDDRRVRPPRTRRPRQSATRRPDRAPRPRRTQHLHHRPGRQDQRPCSRTSSNADAPPASPSSSPRRNPKAKPSPHRSATTSTTA